MKSSSHPDLSSALGKIPNRIQLAGGWIDQPFVSKLNPAGTGSMVVVGLEPTFRVMDRAGCASGTRAIAMRLWKGKLPDRAKDQLVRELYEEENRGKKDPSGSQDMIGLIYPGVNRLDYNFKTNGGVFPHHIESLTAVRQARWLEKVIHLLPIEPRPDGYNPLGEKNLSTRYIQRLGQSGQDCFDAIVKMNLEKLGDALNETILCWEKLLPQTVRHPAIKLDLKSILKAYQRNYPGAMFSGCGGGYLLVVSAKPVPGSFTVTVRTQ